VRVGCPKGKAMDRVRSFLNLERGEEIPVLLLFSYLTLVLTSYIITKAIRDGLFLHKFSPYMLPYVYLGIAAVIGFVVSVYLRISARVGQAAVILGSLVFFIGCILLQWWAVARMQWVPATWIFYVWTSIFGIIVVTQVWTVSNYVLDLRQAKRLFPLIASGGILGSALGGFLAAHLAKLPSVGTDNLMLVLIPILVLVGITAQVLLARYSHSREQRGEMSGRKDFRAALKTIAKSPYLKLIVALLALSNIVTLVVGIQFADVVKHAFPAKNQITSFMGSFSAYFSLFSFLLQVLAGSRMVEKFGVRVMLLVLPLALTGGTVLLLAFPMALWAGTVLKGSDHTLRYSIDRATTELLYLPLPQSIKSEVKAVIDMVMQRVADGVGALLVLFVTLVLRGGQVSLCILNLTVLTLWLWVVLRTRKEYVVTIRSRLTDRPALPKSTLRMVFGDQGSVATLRTMLASRDEEVVLYAIDMALAIGRKDWVTSDLLNHPAPRVRLRALEVVAVSERELLARVQSESNSTVRASALLRASRVAQPGQPDALIAQLLSAPDLKVRLSALVCLARREDADRGTIREVLDQTVGKLEPTSKEWKDVAETLGEIPHPAAVDLHLRLLQHSDPAVKKQAILSAGRAGRREPVPFLVPMLGDPRWAPDARVALREYGPRILGTLADVFKDPTENLEIRRNIPLVLAYIPYQESVEILLDGLFDYDGLLRFRAIRALGKLRVLDPDLRFDAQKVSLRIREECEHSVWFQQALAALYPREGNKDLLLQLFRDKISRGRDRIFRLLTLLLPPTAAVASFLALTEDDRLRRASVAEFLDNVLPGKLKDCILPVIEPRQRLWKQRQDTRQILQACLRSPDPILRECAADAIAKRRWPEYPGVEPAMTRLSKGFNNG
jgi:AAA family ATP:ADP antiporter